LGNARLNISDAAGLWRRLGDLAATDFFMHYLAANTRQIRSQTSAFGITVGFALNRVVLAGGVRGFTGNPYRQPGLRWWESPLQ